MTTDDGCASANGCAAIAVTTVSGADRYNLVGNPFPYNVDWAKVVVEVDGSLLFTPSSAQASGYLSNQIWIYNGNQYETWSDVSLPNPGNLKYFQSFWVKVLAGGAGHTIRLLIPAEISTHSRLAPAIAPDTRLAATVRPGAWLDWLIGPAAAEDFGPGQHPGTHPAEHPARQLPQVTAPAAAEPRSAPRPWCGPTPKVWTPAANGICASWSTNPPPAIRTTTASSASCSAPRAVTTRAISPNCRPSASRS